MREQKLRNVCKIVTVTCVKRSCMRITSMSKSKQSANRERDRVLS